MNKVRRRALALLLILMRMRMTAESSEPTRKIVRKRKKRRSRGIDVKMSSMDLNAKPAKRQAAIDAEKLITAACEEMRINKRLYSRRMRIHRSVRLPDVGAGNVGYQQDYEVEKVLSEKGTGADKMYLVKWLGFTQPTWEPASNLDNCDERIDDLDPGFDELLSDPE